VKTAQAPPLWFSALSSTATRTQDTFYFTYLSQSPLRNFPSSFIAQNLTEVKFYFQPNLCRSRATSQLMASSLRHKFLLLSAISIPASAILLRVYLQDHPLAASKTRTITTTETLSPTSALSSSIHNTVNPRNHIGTEDSRLIHLSKDEIRNLSDEEILERFLKGFFGGWIFTPERTLIASLNRIGRDFIPVGFSGTKTLYRT
jgi:hypothetical protein